MPTNNASSGIESSSSNGVKMAAITITQDMEIITASNSAIEMLGATAFKVSAGRITSSTETAINSLKKSLNHLARDSSLAYVVINPDKLAGTASNSSIMALKKLCQMREGDLLYSLLIFFPNEEAFCSAFAVDFCKLSAAETKIISAIIRHDSLKKVALELEVSINTVKTQLQSIYKKVGVSSKGMLIKKLLTIRNIENVLSLATAG